MASRSYKHLTREPPTQEEVEKLIADLRNVDDRSAAIIGSMLVEDALRALLLSGMIKLNSDMRKDLFGPQRPLESFSARIGIAHAFGLLDKRSYAHLTTIKDVRNIFAHAPRAIKFHTPEIWRLTEKLKATNMLRVYASTPTDHYQSGLLSAPRNLFLTMCRFYEKSLRATVETRRAS